MKMKFLWLLMAILPLFAGCKDEDNPVNGVDDLAFLQNRLAPSEGKVYGLVIDERRPDILYRPVKTVEDAQDEFYKLIPDGRNNKGVEIEKGENGRLFYQLTDAQGNYQGTISYAPVEFGCCAEVTLSPELLDATGYSCLRYVLEDLWPPQSGDFLEDILNKIKK